MEPSLKVQEDLSHRIKRALENFKKSPKERRSSAEYVNTRLELLEELWAQFVLTHTQLVQESDSEDLFKTPYVINGVYDLTEELYIDCKFLMKSTLSQTQHCSTNSSDVPTTANPNSAKELIRLPKISIPTFSGKYSEWISFRDLFVSLIHRNESLDKVQKLHYLKSHLIGEAEQLLRHVQITQDNYSTCWEQLEKRYNNKKYLSNCILKRLMSQRNLSGESASALKELLDTTNECLHGLQNLGIDIQSWDIIIIHIICLKLDSESRKQWELKSSELLDELPTYGQLQDFLETRFRALEFIEPKFSKSSVNFKPANVPAHSKVHHVTTLSCVYCNDAHKLGSCKTFAKIDIDTRRRFVQSHKLCYNCLGSNHSVYACRQTSRCRICKRKHHSLLHLNIVSPLAETGATDQTLTPSVVTAVTTADSSSHDESSSNIKTHFSMARSQVLLATALINARSKSGKTITLRCLLDQGSQASLITESAVQLLGLKKKAHISTISGLGSEKSAPIASKAVVNLSIQSLLDANFEVKVSAYVLSKLTSVLPQRRIVVERWPELSSLDLADPAFNVPNKIDLLLGADVYGRILLEGVIKRTPGSLIAQNTALGWIISGPTDIEEVTKSKNICVNHVNVDDNELLKRFWELESDIFESKKHFTDEELKCEEIFAATTKRDSSGRYIVKLPFRKESPDCQQGNFEAVARKRLFQLERRLDKDPQLKTRYAEVIHEYLELGHMEIVSKEEQSNPTAVYLPHHAVVREERSTSKVRVVFDASCPGTNGVSLNQDLWIGPRLQPDLRHILMRWRLFPICLIADIVKMYRQVKVYPEDADYQRILWRDHTEEPIKHMRLLRITFGTAAAPYLAVRALQQIAYDDAKDYPLVAERILRDFYMDDLLSGCETIEEGETIYSQLNELLKGAGFELQKWNTNEDKLRIKFNEENGRSEKKLELKTDSVMKILGLTWNRNTDEFEYTVQLPSLKEPVTKRQMISDISRLFDPLGWLAPVIVSAKVFIQKLWLSGIEWDEEVPPQLLQDWLRYRDKLNQLNKFSLPRWTNVKKNNVIVELQGFCDASNEAYAAVVYLRTVGEDGKVHVSLITAKTKVAPIKQISIPRLELCGAVLLTKLLMEVADVLSINKMNVHAWTDSTIVLAWLNSRPNRWKTFVANRVSEILTSLEPHQWAHVCTQDNPADCASRGSHNLEQETLWKQGPEWLKENIINYKRVVSNETNLEENKKYIFLANTYDEDNLLSPEKEIISRFSALHKLVRVVALCRRFINYKSKKSRTLWLSREELKIALDICVKLVQKHHFDEEINNLKKNLAVKKSSKLMSLNPVIEPDGILRVGGRLQYAQLSEEMKHPIILPQKSHFTDLVIKDAHEKTLHGGPQLMLNYLRSKFWIVGAKQLVKAYVRKCVVCVRHSASMKHQLMGQLPSVRGTVSRPFCHSGVDYAGPIYMRTAKGRGHHAYKGYICLFICMATRAIHLEPVSDLTAQGFLAAFKRFVARRGRCTDIWSDNGTNFVGAARELKHLFLHEKSTIITEIADSLATNGTKWHMIPPYSPNFGGLWEAGIKSTKFHLKRVIGNTTLTFEEMVTVLSQVEACLNSRPISKISDNVNDQMPLTPGHFLVGEPLVLVPDYNYEAVTFNRLKRWQLSQRMVQDFWRRWAREYLTQFHHRYKWSHQTPEPAVGDIVLVKEENLPPAKWLYGIITDKHSGLDGLTRVVSLRCKGNIIKRPVSKLCFLPLV